jgi:arylsulfatase A-like enzyme
MKLIKQQIHCGVVTCLALVLLLPVFGHPAGTPAAGSTSPKRSKVPNVIVILVDDAGYGDISAYGSRTIKTPAVDRLAREGLRFTDGHSTGATCTPSRYSLLTGEYAFRKPGTGVLPGNAALVIDPARGTLPELMRRAGYTTGVVGKWHLGLGPQGGPDWNTEIRPSPNDIGFDYSYIMAATGDRVPTVYVENRRVVALDPADPISVSYDSPIGDWPTGKANPDLLKMHPSHGHDMTIVNGVSRIGYMTGGRKALWNDEEMADVFTSRAVKFIEEHRSKPFFLYFATHDPHVPRLPHPRFVGKSGMGARGDALVEMDWSVGEILSTLDRLDLTRETIVIFSSDNGPVVDDGYQDQAVEKLGTHRPAGPWRGGKYSNFEAGTRVPFILRWPARVKPGVSTALVSQVDLFASFASLTGQTLKSGEAPDSLNILPALLGESGKGREWLVEQASVLSLREGSWKFITPGKGPSIQKVTNTEMGNDPAGQLYNLAEDPGETRNLINADPTRAARMRQRLEQISKGGH